MENLYGYKKGLKDSLPIFFAYLAVAFSFGIKAINYGFSPIVPIVMSATDLAGAGQFAGIELMHAEDHLAIIFITILLINARYLLMSTAISQFLPEKTNTFKRLLISCFVTDEIFALADINKKRFSIKYFFGLATLPYFGWLGGTILGSFASSFLPERLTLALNIAIYAMFVAIIIPPARKSLPIIICILLASGISCLFYFVTPLKVIPTGVQIIITSLVSAIFCALVFPHKDDDEEETQETLEENEELEENKQQVETQGAKYE